MTKNVDWCSFWLTWHHKLLVMYEVIRDQNINFGFFSRRSWIFPILYGCQLLAFWRSLFQSRLFSNNFKATISAAYNAASIIGLIVTSIFGSKMHRPFWLAIGGLMVSAGAFINTLPQVGFWVKASDYLRYFRVLSELITVLLAKEHCVFEVRTLWKVVIWTICKRTYFWQYNIVWFNMRTWTDSMRRNKINRYWIEIILLDSCWRGHYGLWIFWIYDIRNVISSWHKSTRAASI